MGALTHRDPSVAVESMETLSRACVRADVGVFLTSCAVSDNWSRRDYINNVRYLVPGMDFSFHLAAFSRSFPPLVALNPSPPPHTCFDTEGIQNSRVRKSRRFFSRFPSPFPNEMTDQEHTWLKGAYDT